MTVETLRSLRIAEVMCDFHRILITSTRLWPAGYIPGNHDPDGNNSCGWCATTGALTGSGRWEPFPGSDRLRDAATHEAGHAVVYLANLVPIAYITLAPSDGNELWSGGHITVEACPERDGFAVLTGTWGGQAATMFQLARAGVLDESTTIDAVYTSAADCQQLAGTGATSDTIMAARDAADRIIEQNWAVVETIADKLLVRERITGEELDDIIVKHAIAGCRVGR